MLSLKSSVFNGLPISKRSARNLFVRISTFTSDLSAFCIIHCRFIVLQRGNKISPFGGGFKTGSTLSGLISGFRFYRCENYAINLLEQCENLEEVETFLQTKTFDGLQHKDANYIIAILDSRKKFVAHERFQYVLLKKFGEADVQVRPQY